MKIIVTAGALLLSLWASSPALAASEGALTTEAAATLTPNAYVWRDSATTGNVMIVVSIADQKAYVYRNSTLIAMSAVSTGKEGKETPVGVYPILQKNKDHKSNLYNAAPMPYMQRLTWDGIAIHAGKNPGFPASHGCIRVPTAFAQKLFGITTVGTTVEVTDLSINDLQPADDLVPADVVADAQAADMNGVQAANANRAQLASLQR